VKKYVFLVPVLGNGDVLDIVGHAPVLVLVEHHPPLFFHWAKHGDVQGLGQMSGVGREEDEPAKVYIWVTYRYDTNRVRYGYCTYFKENFCLTSCECRT
jgi:hypothetical protein